MTLQQIVAIYMQRHECLLLFLLYFYFRRRTGSSFWQNQRKKQMKIDHINRPRTASCTITLPSMCDMSSAVETLQTQVGKIKKIKKENSEIVSYPEQNIIHHVTKNSQTPSRCYLRPKECMKSFSSTFKQKAKYSMNPDTRVSQ